MIYYKVKNLPGDEDIIFRSKRYPHCTVTRGELWTEKELIRFFGGTIPKRVLDIMDKIEVSSRKTYWFFGSRFGCDPSL